MPVTATQVVKYFLNKDPDRIVFGKNLIEKNGRKFYDGNARLNKYLHLSQNLYIAKTGRLLFSDALYAYDNGAVALDVLDNYSILRTKENDVALPYEVSKFLDKIYLFLINALLDELIALSHEDKEWMEKNQHFIKSSQTMDSLAYADEYKVQYADAIDVLKTIIV